MHIHDNEEEHFIILEGKALIANGDERAEVTAGSSITIGRGVPHAWCNLSEDAPLHMLCSSAPTRRRERTRIIVHSLHFGVSRERRTLKPWIRKAAQDHSRRTGSARISVPPRRRRRGTGKAIFAATLPPPPFPTSIELTPPLRYTPSSTPTGEQGAPGRRARLLQAAL